MRTCLILAAAMLFACGESTSPMSMMPGAKGDDVPASCGDVQSLNVKLMSHDAEVSSDGDQLSNYVVAKCFSGDQFAENRCCQSAGLFSALSEATTCPARVDLIKPAGYPHLQRCKGSEGFVSSACCKPLCAPGARWSNSGQCLAGGLFEDAICCYLETSVSSRKCEGARWQTITVGDEDRNVCRNEKGRFAMNACCVDKCLASMSASQLTLDSRPEACVQSLVVNPPAQECPADARANAKGMCHNPSNGQFVKAACCEALGTVCTWQAPPPFGGRFDNTWALNDYGFSSRWIRSLSDDPDGLVQKAALQLSFLVPGQAAGDALAMADDAAYKLIELVVDGSRYQWIKFHAGDTEVGVVFDTDLRIVAEISDGDLMGCVPGPQ